MYAGSLCLECRSAGNSAHQQALTLGGIRGTNGGCGGPGTGILGDGAGGTGAGCGGPAAGIVGSRIWGLTAQIDSHFIEQSAAGGSWHMSKSTWNASVSFDCICAICAPCGGGDGGGGGGRGLQRPAGRNSSHSSEQGTNAVAWFAPGKRSAMQDCNTGDLCPPETVNVPGPWLT